MNSRRSRLILRLPAFVLAVCAIAFAPALLAPAPGPSPSALAQSVPSTARAQEILAYISAGWETLTRSLDRCDTVADTKVATPSILYIPADYPVPSAAEHLQHDCNVRVEHLPKVIHALGEMDSGAVNPPGLLFLEHPYVVPGGRFNEMYGWDSYFIVRGLLRDGRIELARDMVENFFFEDSHYGAVLNANRTYYLTRSQPPFLTSMILAVYDSERAQGHDDRAWLARAYDDALKDYSLWTRAPHLAGSTGLARYYDFGHGPAPETLKDEPDYYRNVAEYFRAHPGESEGEIADSGADGAPHLSGDYYEGDRAMRESGFDISFRFGPYGARTHHFAPVCLNSLLYKEEKDLERITAILGRAKAANEWNDRAETRRRRINQYLWDARRGMYFDYDFEKRARSTYAYATTFYPLWAGAATKAQARAVARHLKTFERSGGLATSDRETGAQWDYPYAWAPIQLLAVEGLRRYGLDVPADRISNEFLSMVKENFQREGTIREKYNAVTRSSQVQVSAGYSTNVVGFGWTNGVFLELLHDLPPAAADRVKAKD